MMSQQVPDAWGWVGQEMRTFRQAEEAGRAAGLELLTSLDIAVASAVAGPWYGLPVPIITHR